MTRVREGCPCECQCLEDDAPNGGCHCLEKNCLCTLVEAELWHTPKIILKRKMDAYGPLYAGACVTCSWVSTGLETEPRAWRSARAHAHDRNAALYNDLLKETGDGDRRQQEGLGTAGGDAPEAGQPAPAEPAPRRRRQGRSGGTDAGEDQGDGR